MKDLRQRARKLSERLNGITPYSEQASPLPFLSNVADSSLPALTDHPPEAFEQYRAPLLCGRRNNDEEAWYQMQQFCDHAARCCDACFATGKGTWRLDATKFEHRDLTEATTIAALLGSLEEDLTEPAPETSKCELSPEVQSYLDRKGLEIYLMSRQELEGAIKQIAHRASYTKLIDDETTRMAALSWRLARVIEGENK